DLNQNGILEIAIPESDSLRLFEVFSSEAIPFAPKGNSTLDSVVALTWTNTSGVVYIFKAEEGQGLALTDSVNGNSYRDINVVSGETYSYAVSKSPALLPGNNSGITQV